MYQTPTQLEMAQNTDMINLMKQENEIISRLVEEEKKKHPLPKIIRKDDFYKTFPSVER